MTDATITGGETITDGAVPPIDRRWDTTAAAAPCWSWSVPAPGDFSLYTLTPPARDGAGDTFFAHVTFSFKAGCPSTSTATRRAPACPPADGHAAADRLPGQGLPELPPGALRLLRAALPGLAGAIRGRLRRDVPGGAGRAWPTTSATRRTASPPRPGWRRRPQRRSLVRHARLVDYEPRVATAARVCWPFEMAPGAAGPIPAGLVVSAQAPDGTPIDFETGTGLGRRAQLSGALRLERDPGRTGGTTPSAACRAARRRCGSRSPPSLQDRPNGS